MSKLKIGDVVQSVKRETIIGTVISFTARGTMIVKVDGKPMVTIPEYWRRISR